MKTIKVEDFMITELPQVKESDFMITEMPKKKFDNETYCKSAEWRAELEEAETAKNKNYTVIYRDTDESLREAWHFLDNKGIDYVRAKYKRANKEIIYFIEKEKPFGEFLKSISGGSKND